MTLTDHKEKNIHMILEPVSVEYTLTSQSKRVQVDTSFFIEGKITVAGQF